ncbi:Spermidine/putrescine import ATP-binding protein PotA [Hyella patelloides LEGE 07179]|uniref:ABC-type quaternary amine transporter n=1 Tax=Hyella patelloides LEGE 07179 TaxID=945734 RepID=A0A563VNL0_9CYAN|nr:ABC transporter ATP-binding protein [Hyella patelloides]VEP13056.1 Spermidine/putrescine import ATP-binding protein PotA [Hyella patelloides LEGE 07179]
MEVSSILQLKKVTKKYPSASIPAVDEVSLTLKQGELLGLLGPSGCGKTTLLRIVAGFEKISQGEVELAGKLICDRYCNTPPEKRNTGMVFQDYALFPHLTVADNIAFGLKGKKSFGRLSSKDIKYRIGEVLNLVGLSGLEKRYPHELSGGQQQRVALARALAPRPALILLDEPLSNLDVQVRHRLREEIRRILKAAGISAIFVTHDREEALAISDQIAVMRDGKLEQVGTPEEIYTKPGSRFVAEFVTQANFLTAKREGELWKTEIGEVDLKSLLATQQEDGLNLIDRAEVMLRQEDIILTPDCNSSVVVKERQFLGREYRYCLETASGKRLHARTNISNAVDVGTNVNLSMIQAKPLIFPFANLNKNKVTI